MKTVLLIEDHPDIRENICELLELEGYKVFVAVNGKVGIDLALENKPDIILCDIMGPETDSRAFLKLASEDKVIRDIPYILFSEDSSDSQIRNTAAKQNNAFILTKPFEARDLLNAITERLNEKRAETPTTIGQNHSRKPS